MSYLDQYVTAAAELAAEQGDGLWIQAPSPKNRIWIVSALSVCHSPDRLDYQWHPRLQDAIGKFNYKRLGYHTWTDVQEDGEIRKLASLLARTGDALHISKDGSWWVLQAEELKLHAVGQNLVVTASNLIAAVEQHYQLTIYANDNCPLD